MVTANVTQPQLQDAANLDSRTRPSIRRFLPAAIGLVMLFSGCQSPPMSPLSDPFANAAPPRYTVNDTYTYRISDGFGNLPPGQVTFHVDKIDGDRVMVSVTSDIRRIGAPRTEIVTRDGNWVRHVLANQLEWAEYEFSPALPIYAFPLTSGKSWSMRVNASNPQKGQRSVRIDGKVVGAERVRVPAGEFDTIKIRRDVYAGDSPETHYTEFEWYAPALGRAVRMESKSEWRTECFRCDPFAYGDWDIYELSSSPTPAR